MANAQLLGDRPAVAEATPKCGDFCDACGDCLHCYWEDPCGRYGDDGHVWVVYSEQVADFLAAHPRRAGRPLDHVSRVCQDLDPS